MRAFVTGGSGFIGRHVVRKLVERGYEVTALAHSDHGADSLRAMAATVVRGDITDAESMHESMRGVDVVFHIAAWYRIGHKDWMQAEMINVGGTRTVLNLAVELEIPKIVYTSTAAVFGDTRGQLVDENYRSAGPFRSEYDRTKWLAHYKVAEPLIEQGAPIIIAMPGATYGPEDHSLVGVLMSQFYQNSPILFGSDTILAFTHVEDIAEGIILAAEKGRLGQSYVLAGPAVPLGEMFDFWSYLTGKPAPAIRIPSRFLHPFAPLVSLIESFVPLPPHFSREAIDVAGVSYAARSDKARAELGWQPRPLQAGMLETFNWIARTTPSNDLANRERQIAGMALLTATFFLLLWLFGRNRNTT